MPQQCVVQTQGQASLWVVRPDSVAEYRKVELGETVGAMWIIDKGLSAGEQVVSNGQQKIRNGMKVAPRK